MKWLVTSIDNRIYLIPSRIDGDLVLYVGFVCM